MAVISVEGVEKSTGDGVVACFVRCLEGTVSIGDAFDVAVLNSGASVSVALRIVRIWRYGRGADLLDPPHTAKLELAGRDAELISGFTRLATSIMTGTSQQNDPVWWRRQPGFPV